MKNENELYVSHEVRIRMAEQSYADLKTSLIRVEKKVDSHFKWLLGTMIGIFVGVFGVIYPLLAGVLLRMTKVI